MVGGHIARCSFKKDQDLPGDITPVEHVLGDDAPISLDKEGARAACGAERPKLLCAAIFA